MFCAWIIGWLVCFCLDFSKKKFLHRIIALFFGNAAAVIISGEKKLKTCKLKNM